MRRLRAFAIFCYDFVVGDDWRIALAVVIGLTLTWAATRIGLAGWLVLPLFVAAALAWSLLRARRAVVRAAKVTPDE